MPKKLWGLHGLRDGNDAARPHRHLLFGKMKWPAYYDHLPGLCLYCANAFFHKRKDMACVRVGHSIKAEGRCAWQLMWSSE